MLKTSTVHLTPGALARRVSAVTSGAPSAVTTADLEKFAGRYISAWGETVIVPWRDGLAALEVPTDDPAGDLVRLRHIDGNTFRRVRDDGDDLGEEVVFEGDTAGSITRFLWHQNYSAKVR